MLERDFFERENNRKCFEYCLASLSFSSEKHLTVMQELVLSTRHQVDRATFLCRYQLSAVVDLIDVPHKTAFSRIQ